MGENLKSCCLFLLRFMRQQPRHALLQFGALLIVAGAALAFRPKILYPYHYGQTDTGRLEALLKGSGIEVRIRKME